MVRGIRKDSGELLESEHVQLFDGVAWVEVELATVDGRPKGRWLGLEYDGYADGYPVYDLWGCSECGGEYCGEDVPVEYMYCPNCGADMRGE